MFPKIKNTIQALHFESISSERKQLLAPLVQFIQSKIDSKQDILLHFICTHNSRRSLFSQVWAQAIAAYYSIPSVHCYSGGTERTMLFPKVADTLQKSGFKIEVEPKGSNPIYQIQFAKNIEPIQAFSKKYDDPVNPSSGFAAILTCSNAAENCPIISGAEQSIPITYEDPKVSDGTTLQNEVYFKRSMEIASEINYVFSQLI